MSSFHGHFFVRSTDLLSMPSIPQDQSYSIEVQIDENLSLYLAEPALVEDWLRPEEDEAWAPWQNTPVSIGHTAISGA